MDRFKDHFGSDPVVHAQIWEDLQTSENEDLRVSGKASADSFLQGMHFLKCHPKEEERSGLFKVCKTAARNWGWHFAEKVQALKEEKVSLKQFAADAPPEDNCQHSFLPSCFICAARLLGRSVGRMAIHRLMMKAARHSSSRSMACIVMSMSPATKLSRRTPSAARTSLAKLVWTTSLASRFATVASCG